MRLLIIELRKVIWYRAFWISTLGYLLLMPLLFVSLANFNIQVSGGTSLGLNLYLFPQVWQNVSYMASWFNLLLYFFVILLVTNEFQFRTLRQNIIDGLSREEVLIGKLLLLLLFTVVSTLLVAAVGLGCGLAYGEGVNWQTAFEKIHFVPIFFLQCYATLVFALFLSLLVQKQGLTIIAYLFYSMVLENVLRFKLLPKGWGEYLPMKTISDLIPNPFPAMLGMGVAKDPELNTLLFTVGYIVLFSLASWGWLRWRDV
jgi:ABC-2 type transport system permease protein